MEGGAKQALHYTNVTPPVVVFAVTKGGNHIFNYIIGANGHGLPTLKIEALKEVLDIYKEEILSDIYVGWVKGYMDEERQKLIDFAKEGAGKGLKIGHPKETFKDFIEAIKDGKNSSWME
jgi:CRISPR-associated protein Cst2